MHPAELREEVRRLSASGLFDSEVAAMTGLPRRTVWDMRRESDDAHRARRPRCPRCWRPARPAVISSAAYAELLGFYLGDGHVSRAGRTWRLRVALDAAYPKVVDQVKDTLAACFPANSVGTVPADDGSTVVVWVYSSHVVCLLPQHGPGKKHERRLSFEDWQCAHVAAAPWAFLRGCLWSDGCRFVNRTGRYAYDSYEFANRSTDIKDLFCATCDRVGVEYRRYPRYIRIYRRASVALLDRHVGGKR